MTNCFLLKTRKYRYLFVQAGKDADIILFDDHIRVARTLIGGKTVATSDRTVQVQLT